MLITLQGWPRGQGRDAPMSAIYIHKPHRRIEVMAYNPTSFRIIWKINKNRFRKNCSVRKVWLLRLWALCL